MSDSFKISWKQYLSEKRWREESVIDPLKDCRNPFEVDYGKIVFCPALRRMHDKTQVIPLSSGDCVLTRLTHSLQVMNIAESLACNYTRSEAFKSLYERDEEAYEDAQRIRAILKSGSLLHDIGNPPFGHFGEQTIKDYFKLFFNSGKSKDLNIDDISENERIDFTQFDGNAQGFRIVSKLQYTGYLDGLNLTYGTLGAYLKYPNDGAKKGDDDYVGYHKHGIFKTEQELFRKVVSECNMRRADGTVKRHPLAFLVEAADTICYSTMDVEDGLYQNWFTISYLIKELNYFIRNSTKKDVDVREIIEWNISDDDLRNNDSRLVRLELREHLITYLVDLTIRNFVNNLQEIDSGEFNSELVYEDANCLAKALKVFTKREILSNKNVLKFEITGNSVISGLLDILIKYFFHSDSSYHRRLNGIISECRLSLCMKENQVGDYPLMYAIPPHDISSFDVKALSNYAKLRIIVDFVSGMTDKYSVELYQTLSGNSL